jgi:predicted RNA binding protein YcfA (HicA-like mRNA interferase family)
MKVRNILRRLANEGWILKAVKGLHHHYVHAQKSGKATIAFDQRGDEIGQETLRSIFKPAGWR